MASLQEWLDNFQQQNVAIWCDDPEAHKEKIAGGLGGKTYLSYRILYKQAGRDVVGVRHRYSEFESMRVELRDRYHPLGILVPALPPKNLITSMTSTMLTGGTNKVDQPFVKERTLGLTLFCESVVAIPWLRHDSSWKSFLLPPSNVCISSIYDAADEYSEIKVENIGEQQIISCLQRVEVPYKYTMTQRLDELKEEVNIMEKYSKYLLEKVRNVQTCQRSLQQAEEQFRQGLEGWMDVERLHLKSLTGKIFNEYENVLKPEEQTTTTLGALSSMLSTKGECDRHSGDYIGITLIAALEQQLSLADGLRDLFKTHDDLLSNLDAVNSKISKLESTINSGGGWMGSSTTNISVAKEQLTESKKQLQERTYALHTFYKGLVYFTIPLMARMRAGILRRLCAVYSSCMLSECYSGYKACIDFFKQSMLSAERVSDIAYKLCDTLSITPVPKLPPHVYRGGFMNGSEDVEEDEDTTIYDSSGFLSQDTNGMAGLYDRSMMISKGKSYSSSSTNATSTSNSAAEGDNQSPTNSSSSAGTHLFTSNINTRAEMLESSRSNSTTAPFSPSGEQANPLKSKRGSSVAKSNRTKYTNTIDTELFNDDNAPIEPSPLSSSSADKMEVGSTTEEVENVVSSNPAQRRQSVGANLTYGDTYGEEEEEQMGGSSSVFSDKPSSVLSSLMDGVGGGNPMKSNSSSKIKSDYTFGGHSPMRKSAFDD